MEKAFALVLCLAVLVRAASAGESEGELHLCPDVCDSQTCAGKSCFESFGDYFAAHQRYLIKGVDDPDTDPCSAALAELLEECPQCDVGGAACSAKTSTATGGAGATGAATAHTATGTLGGATGTGAAATVATATGAAATHSECPQAGICMDNNCNGRSCGVVLDEMMKAAGAQSGETGSNNPDAKPHKSMCDVALGNLFHTCKTCEAAGGHCPSNLFSLKEAAQGYTPSVPSKVSGATVMGLAGASALAVALAIARSRSAAGAAQLLQGEGTQAEALETSMMETDA